MANRSFRGKNDTWLYIIYQSYVIWLYVNNSYRYIYDYMSVTHIWLHWKKLYLLSKTLVSLGIMVAQFRATFEHLSTIECCDSPRGFRGAHQLGHYSMPVDASPSENFTRPIAIVFSSIGRYMYDVYMFAWQCWICICYCESAEQDIPLSP